MIPEFKRPELEDKELIDYYFAQAPSRSCERTFANVYLWSRQYKVKYAILHNALVFRDEGDGVRDAVRYDQRGVLALYVCQITQHGGSASDRIPVRMGVDDDGDAG